MITEFSWNHVGILLLAVRWTLLVSLLAFVGGTLAGLNGSIPNAPVARSRSDLSRVPSLPGSPGSGILL